MARTKKEQDCDYIELLTRDSARIMERLRDIMSRDTDDPLAIFGTAEDQIDFKNLEEALKNGFRILH